MARDIAYKSGGVDRSPLMFSADGPWSKKTLAGKAQFAYVGFMAMLFYGLVDALLKRLFGSTHEERALHATTVPGVHQASFTHGARLGALMTSNMTVMRVHDSDDDDDGALVLYSVTPATSAAVAAVRALGTVRYIVVPSIFHDSWCGQWAKLFPDALVLTPRTSIPFLEGTAGVTTALAMEDELPKLAGFEVHAAAPGTFHAGWCELAVEYTSPDDDGARAVLVNDLIGHIAWTNVYTAATGWLLGFTGKPQLLPLYTLVAVADARAHRRFIGQLAQLRPAVLFMSHGEPITSGAPALLEKLAALR